ncbi:hypothetical protein DITRI_Ditri01bG0162600 [Diplodiscus trichospermus]
MSSGGEKGLLRIEVSKLKLRHSDGVASYEVWGVPSHRFLILSMAGPVHSPVVQLLDLGNLVVKDEGDTGKFKYQFELGEYPEIVIREGSTVIFWSGPYNDGGQDIYVKVAASKLSMKQQIEMAPSADGSSGYQSHKEDLELPLFDLTATMSTTNHFSMNKILGGGFGCVYRGVLKDGQEIAMKRLSKSLKQGLDEFTNEVKHIAKLQHRNLVKLLGCCIQADEKMLIYEYMPNKSLDFFIFGFNHPDHHHNLLGHAWKLFCESNSLELVADSIKNICDQFEVLRSIHVGLLCVQRSLEDRPSMSNVVLMFSEVPLPQPKQPGIFTERSG